MDKNIKKIRLSHDLSQQRVANFLGISLQRYIRYERNAEKIPLAIAIKLKEILKDWETGL